jgi:hypothetical protein
MKTPRPTFGKILAGTAVVLVATTGTAYAANTVGSDDIIDDSIQSVDIKNETVTSVDVLNNSLASADIRNSSIVSNDINDGGVASVDILDGTIASADVADGSLSSADILDGTIASSDVADGALTSADILDETLGQADLANSSVGSSEIATDAVGPTEIADDSIDAGEIVDFGLTNQDVGVLFAQVSAVGVLDNSSGGGVVVTKLAGAGQYEVDFNRNIASCAFTATIGPSGGGSAAGQVNVADRAGNSEAVFVDTNGVTGTAVNLPFQLIVVC